MCPGLRRFNYIFRENPAPVCPPKRKRNFRESETFPLVTCTIAILPPRRLGPPPLSNPRGNCCAANCFSSYRTPFHPFSPHLSIYIYIYTYITAATLSSTFNVRVIGKGVGRRLLFENYSAAKWNYLSRLARAARIFRLLTFISDN